MERIPGDPGKPLVFRQLAVSDQAVDPEIGNHNLERIAAWLQQSRGNGDPPGLAPHNSQVTIVDFDGGYIGNAPQREKVAHPGVEPIAIKGSPVGRFSGVVLDSGLRSPAPVFELRENDPLRPTPFRIKTDIPGRGKCSNGYIARKVCSTAGGIPGRRLAEHNEAALEGFQAHGYLGAAIALSKLWQIADLSRDGIPPLRLAARHTKAALGLLRPVFAVGDEIEILAAILAMDRAQGRV